MSRIRVIKMVMPWELSILDGDHALLLQAKLAVIGDTTITGDLDVSGEIIGGTIPIENLSNVDKQSFDSLIDNGDFKLWSNGDSNAPDEWESHNSPTIKRETSIVKTGASSVKLTASQVASRIRGYVIPYAYYQGKTVTMGCWVHASATGAIIALRDGLTSTSSSKHSGGGAWEWLTVTKVLSGSANELRVSCEPDNTNGVGVAYFDGAILVEGPICPAFSPKPLTDVHTYGEMYIYNNSNATVIETANIPIALRQISGGVQKGFIFDAGSTGAIAAYTDYSGTVAGAVLVGDIGHGLTTGDIITIRGSTNYNGIFAITVVDSASFYIMDTWVADDGASDWDQGASLTAQAGADGVYTSTWQMTTAPAGACELCFKVNINETPQDKSTACRDMAINDKDNNSSTCLMTIVEGDIIWLSVESDATSSITNSMGNMYLERM